MKKALITMMCLTALFALGTGLKAQEITIVLEPGYNWISYPNAEAMPVVEALGSFTPSNGDIIQSQFGGLSRYFNGNWRGGVTHFIPGWGYHYYSARSEVVEFVFAQPASNVVTTDEPTDITLTSAVVGGTVTLPEGSQVFLRGVCWGTEPRPDIDGDHTTEETGIGSFSNTLEDLNPNTTYYLRAYVIYDHGLSYGNELSFTTLSGIPVVTTAEVTDVTATTATCGGMVTDDGGLDITARGVCWSTSSNPTIVDAHSTDGTGTGNFSSTLTGLTPNTTYFVRAYATNSYVTVYGNQRSFTTAPLPSCTVSVTCNPTEGGTITGGGTYEQGQSCTLTATANEGYTFTNWTENGSQVSTNATYTFTVNADRTLVANFIQSGSGGDAPTGAIDGKFTINADGDQVYFSQGNLQYIGSAATPYWKFADNQWDYFGEDQNGDVYNIDRDLFGWGTSGYDHGAVCYQPWSTDQNDGRYSAYGGDYYNLYDQSGKADWGYNPISNGGNSVNQWRTMSANEWGYIFNTRNTESGIRFAKAVVNGVNGVVLLPDNWRTSNYVLNNTNDRGANYDNNNISAADWKNILEAQGAVFLPAAGDRWGTSVVEAATGGFYWSSSCKGGSQACDISFRSNEMCLDGYCGYYRHCGRSVRLVRSAGDMSYYIDAASNPDEGGTVTGAGTYDEGSTCILMAIANEGYTFINWTENGVEVSTQATYSFTVTSNRNLVANFVPNSGVPIGAVNGRFTINEEGDQVYFSQGNLQYTKSTQTWSFMEHQYDVIVTEGQDVGDDYANTDIVSHFCWGTSGCNLRGTETDYYYQPYNTYQGSGDAYGPSGSHNLTGDYANGDWGVYNAISNGGNVDNYWRTLTRDEWYYLFTGRDDALSKWERGNIDGVNGVILLPDDWELPEGLTFNVIDESDYEANTYTLQQWETMQAAGAVFLPASGWRRGTEVSEVNNLVGYWSSTYEYGFSAHNIWIENYGSSSHTVFNDGSYRYRGYAVRLVRDAGIVSYSIDAAPSPTEGGTVTGTGTFNEGASCTLTAMPNEGYTFVNWTENGVEVSTQATYSFTVTSNRTLAANFTYNGGGASHEYVDLGLPSGTLWATCNVGADTPEGYGDYFAWGETQPKDTYYSWSTYQYCMGSNSTMTKYCNYSGYGYNGFTDNLTTLLPEDDAATANWGSEWRMPTKEEFQELLDNTTVTWTTQNGVNGRLFTAPNGNSLFLPAAGNRVSTSLSGTGGYGYYWSSSLVTDSPCYAWDFGFYSDGFRMAGNYRYYGQSVRGVRSSRQN